MGDVITTTIACTSTPSGSDYGISIYDDRDGELVGTLYCTKKNTAETFSYTIKEGDALIGKSDFYLFRAIGKSTYIISVKVTRSATGGEGEEPGGEDEESNDNVETVILSWNEVPTLSNSEGKEYKKDTNGNNVATWSNGYSITITGNTAKDQSNGSDIKIDGNKYKTIKVSNGAQNTLKLPEGKITRKIILYSYVNEDEKTADSYWQEVAGQNYTDVLESYKGDTENPDKREYTFNATNEVTFTNKGKQLCYVLFVEVEDANETMKVGKAGYRTFTSRYALDFTDGEKLGLTAYAATLNVDGDIDIEFTPITGKVPAKTGMLIKAEEGTYSIPKAFDNPTTIENVFEGVTVKTEIEDPIFILYADDDKEIGFYKTKGTFTVGANTAYIPATISYGLNKISFIGIPGKGGDGTTSLNSIKNVETENGKLYDLQGRQVSNPTKGLYISNGKKYIVK